MAAAASTTTGNGARRQTAIAPTPTPTTRASRCSDLPFANVEVATSAAISETATRLTIALGEQGQTAGAEEEGRRRAHRVGAEREHEHPRPGHTGSRWFDDDAVRPRAPTLASSNGPPGGRKGVVASAIAAPVAAATRPSRRRSCGASIASSPAGKAASMPKRRRIADQARAERPDGGADVPADEERDAHHQECPLRELRRGLREGERRGLVDHDVARERPAQPAPGQHPREREAVGDVARVQDERREHGCGRARARRDQADHEELRAPGEDEHRDAADEPGARARRERPKTPNEAPISDAASAMDSAVRSSAPVGRGHRGASCRAPAEARAGSRPYDPGVTLDPGVFKAYDVRGVVPDELDADGAYRIARAYVDEFEPTRDRGRPRHAADLARSCPRPRSAAPSTPAATSTTSGSRGTEMLYFAVGEHGYEGGFTITASHNPTHYNGLKMVRRGALPVGGDSGLDRVRERALRGRVPRRPRSPASAPRATCSASSPTRCLSLVDPSAIAPLNVVIDAANGMGGYMIAPILERLPIVVERCHFEPGRQLPALRAEPAPAGEPRVHRRPRCARPAPTSASPSTATAIAASSSTTRASSSPGDFITALIAELDAAARARARRSSTTSAPRTRCRSSSSAWAAAPCRAASVTPTSSTASARRTRSSPARCSGHYYFRDFYGVDTGIVPALVVLELVSRAGRQALRAAGARCSEGHHLSGEINSKVAGRPAQAAGAEGALRPARRRRARLAPRRADGRVRRLVVQRPPVEHRAAPAAQPRGADATTEMERRRDEVLAVITA